VGIDLVDTDEGPVVLEVNPRLTTSYVGLADTIGTNPAGLVLDLLKAGAGLAAEPGSVKPVPVRVDDGPGVSRA
jgi:predicted ATP-grasp superfamily ATP-dependent carboligase